MSPTLDELETAAAQVHAVIAPTLQYNWPLLAQRCGCEVWVKHENHTPIGAFKVRGGVIFMNDFAQRGGKAGIVTATRGNHGQSIGFAARTAGVKATIVVPEIVDYEIRRELIRARRTRGIDRLDALILQTSYLAITTAAMHRAASFWADARQTGRPAAVDTALDADVILAGKADTIGQGDVIVATTNVSHLSRFVPAALWPEISA